MSSDHLRNRLDRFTQVLIRRYGISNRLPATVIGAENASKRKVAASGNVPFHLAPVLYGALLSLGVPIGERRGRNKTGRCCEVRSSNLILLKDLKLGIYDIDFTTAVRPRTGVIIPRCNNCIDVFGV